MTRPLEHLFEHEEEVSTATKRQQEIVAALDITKNQASAKMDEGPEQAAEVVDEAPQQSIQKGKLARVSVAA